MARCSLILSNMEKSFGSHEFRPKGLSTFGCLPWKCFPLNYYTVPYRFTTNKNSFVQFAILYSFAENPGI